MEIILHIDKIDNDKISCKIFVCEIDAKIDPKFASVNVLHHRDVMSEGVWATAFEIPDTTEFTHVCEINNCAPGTYSISICAQSGYKFSMTPDEAREIIRQYFKIDGDLILLDDSEREIIAERQRNNNFEPQYSSRARDGESSQSFEVCIFFEGVEIVHPIGMRGMSLFPISGRIGDEGTIEAIAQFLKGRNNIEMGDKANWTQLVCKTPGFALVIHNIIAVDHDDAAKHALVLSKNIALIVGLQQGERARALATMSLAYTGEWKIEKIRKFSRSNLLPPLGIHNIIEHILPLISSSNFLRILFEIYNETLGEHSRDVRTFRIWSILELIAKKEFHRKGETVKDLSGAKILKSDGSPFTTRDPVGLFIDTS
jgi:hypothetical protein